MGHEDYTEVDPSMWYENLISSWEDYKWGDPEVTNTTCVQARPVTRTIGTQTNKQPGTSERDAVVAILVVVVSIAVMVVISVR